MKFDFYHFGSDLVVGDTYDRLPILDWDGYWAGKVFEHSYKGPGQNGFTGEYNDVIYLSLTLFRYKFNLRIDFKHGKTTPELAFREYHDRIKAKRQKEG